MTTQKRRFRLAATRDILSLWVYCKVISRTIVRIFACGVIYGKYHISQLEQEHEAPRQNGCRAVPGAYAVIAVGFLRGAAFQAPILHLTPQTVSVRPELDTLSPKR